MRALALVLVAGVAAAAGARAEEAVPASAGELRYSFAPVVRKTAPAVVNVYVTTRKREFVSPFRDPFFRQFFEDELGAPRERRENSLGSGVIVSADGLVVTNAHVIKGSGEADIKVALADKREFDARVLLIDASADLAVLRIDSPHADFPFLAFVDSDALEVGDIVLAIGNPFGVGQTVTSGIVSALARTGIGKGDAQYFIQTDAAINPGNSGGALVDIEGRLAGINTAIFSRSGGSHGIGFAIPSNQVRPFVDSALSGQKLKRPWLGAKLTPVTREIADAAGLERVSGALVTKVYPSGPGVKAGLAEQDIIVGIDEHEVEDPRALTYRINNKGVGAEATLKVFRGGAEKTIAIALEEAPGLDDAAQRDLSGAHPFDGARVAEIGRELAEEIGLQDFAGVVITGVRSGSIAQGLGLRPGDVVLRVNGARVDRIERLEKVLGDQRQLWRLVIQRGNQVIQMAVPG